MTALHEATAYDVPVTRELAAAALPRQRSASRSVPARVARPATTGSHRAIPAQRSADTGRHPRSARLLARRWPRPPRRSSRPRLPSTSSSSARSSSAATPRRHWLRPTVLLGALVAGGLVAGFLSFTGADDAAAQATSVLAAQDDLFAVDELEAMPMASITEEQAQARLDQVAASRKDRADARRRRRGGRRARRPGPSGCCR